MLLDTLARWVGSVATVARIARQQPAQIFVQDYQDIGGRSVLRDPFLLELSAGRRVLHFGFLDAPFSKERIESGRLLHSRLGAKASYLYGVDIDPQSLELYRQCTGDRENCLLDIQAEASDFDELGRDFEVILFAEILEHLRNPGKALDNLHRIAQLNPGCRVCVTVPNAFSLKGLARAIDGIELVHPDHFAYFSPHTLRHLLEASGFRNIELKFYWYTTPSKTPVPGLLQEGVIALCEA